MKYEYKIIKTYNKVGQRTMYRGRDYPSIKNKYVSLMEKSQKVTIPKKFLNKNGLKPLLMELLLISDNPQMKRIALAGKEVKDKSGKKWWVLDVRKYNEEEKFFSYPNEEYLHYSNIYIYLKKQPRFTSVYLFLNKIIVDSSFKIEKLIVCKNITEAKFVYHKLSKDNLNVAFLGKLNAKKRRSMKEKIISHTNIHPKRLMSKQSKN